MKRQISIFTLLTGAILTGCALLGWILITLYLQQAEEVSQADLEQRLRSHQAQLETVLGSMMRYDRLQLRVLQSRINATPEGFDDFQSLASAVQREALVADERFDRLLLGSADGGLCVDYSSPLHAGGCSDVIRGLDNPLYPWHLYESNGQAGLVTRVPLLEQRTGRVLGYLYSGIVLSDNFGLLSEVLSSLHQGGVQIALLLDGRLIANTAASDPEALALMQEATTQNRPQIARNQLIARRMPLMPAHESDRLELMVVTDRSNEERLRNQFVESAVTVIIIGALAALALVMAATRLALSPLLALIRFTQSHDMDEEPPPGGPVREVSLISKTIATYVQELSRSRAQLESYSRELEAAHRETQQTNAMLHERTLQLEESNARLEQLMRQNKALLHRLFHLQEEERQQLAEELHDHLGQPLAALRAEAHLLRHLDADRDAVRDAADRIGHSAQAMYDVVYNRIIELRPMPLNDFGLSEALRHMPVVDSLRRAGVHVVLTIPRQVPRLRGEIEIALFRIAQEALTNVLHHAQASEAALMLEYHDQHLELCIRDNGRGFDPDHPPNPGFGLESMRERCIAAGGELLIDSGPHGTRVLARVPVDADRLSER